MYYVINVASQNTGAKVGFKKWSWKNWLIILEKIKSYLPHTKIKNEI